jgi:preprotein translocase subunit SecD
MLSMSKDTLLFTDGLSKDDIKNRILEMNKTTVVVSEKETELEAWLAERNISFVEKKDAEMKPLLGKGKEAAGLDEWAAIGLLSGPLLSDSLATGKASQQYVIEGQSQGATIDEKKEYALMEMKKIKSILSGGALPVRMSLGSTTTVPPSLGKDFLSYSIVGIVLVYIVVLLIVFVRYRNPQMIPVLVFIPTCQIACLIAILAGAGTLDLATIAGLFASMGTAVDAQVVVTDELFSKKLESNDDAQRRINKAFYIITRDAAIVIFGLFPLLFSNLVEIIGFITAMVLGTLINIIITTQTYRAVAQTMFKQQ